MKPNFVGIGAQKCASTWLYDVLATHPQSNMSDLKELDFFTRYYDYGYQWYERNFPEANALVVGEISPSYLNSAEAPARVKTYNPDAKLLVSLRHPVERAISNHRHDVRIGLFQGQDMSLQAGLANNPAYIDQGLYAKHLTAWLEHFPKSQLKVVLVDDIKADAAATAASVYEFLGLDAKHKSELLHTRSNESYVNRSSGLERTKNQVRGVIRKLGLGPVWNGLGNLGLKNAYRNANRAPSSSVIPKPSAQVLAELSEAFRSDIEQLEVLLERSLEHWKQTPG